MAVHPWPLSTHAQRSAASTGGAADVVHASAGGWGRGLERPATFVATRPPLLARAHAALDLLSTAALFAVPRTRRRARRLDPDLLVGWFEASRAAARIVPAGNGVLPQPADREVCASLGTSGSRSRYRAFDRCGAWSLAAPPSVCVSWTMSRTELGGALRRGDQRQLLLVGGELIA